MRYFIHLGFDGSSYSGWQKQQNTRNTIQEVLEDTLSRIFKKRITVYGCGRTDAGVHASQYVLHINLATAPTFDLKFRLNKNLPDSIAVYELIEVDEAYHCRYDASARTYDYFLHWKKDPALSRYSSYYDGLELDLGRMQQAALLIEQTRDCKALCKHPDLYDNTLCEISHCRLYVNEEQGRLRMSIRSNRFLRGMVRLSMYFLLRVGRGQMTLAELTDILNLQKQLAHKRPALPNGLFLSKVEYPFLELEEQHHLIKILRLGLVPIGEEG